jgi:hypothetical protein
MPLCPPQISHDLTWGRTWTSTLGRLQLRQQSIKIFLLFNVIVLWEGEHSWRILKSIFWKSILMIFSELTVLAWMLNVLWQLVGCLAQQLYLTYLNRCRPCTECHRSSSPCGYRCCNPVWTAEVLLLDRSYRTLSGQIRQWSTGDIPPQLEEQISYLVWFSKKINLFSKIIFCRWKTGPPLWFSGQSSWLQMQRSGFDSQRYQTFWEVVGLERGPLSLVSTIEEFLESKNSGSGLENRDYRRRGLAALTTRQSPYPQKLALTSPTSGGRSVGIVRSQTQTT